MLLIGPPLAGKTNTLFQFPDPWIGDADDKMGNAVHRFPGKTFWFDQFNRKPVKDKEGKFTGEYVKVEPELQWMYFNDCLNEALKSPLVRTIGLDSLSALTDMLIQHILKVSGSKLNLGGIPMMEKSHWGPFRDIMKRTIMGIRSYGKNLVVVAHETVDKDDLTGAIMNRPLVPGELKSNLGGMFTDVWHQESREVPDPKNPGKLMRKYFVRTQPLANFPLGTSLPDLPLEFEVTWPEIEKRLKQAQALAEAAQAAAIVKEQAAVKAA